MTPDMAPGALWSWLSDVFAAPLDAAGVAAALADCSRIEALERPALAPGVHRMRAALAALPASTEGVAALAHSYCLLFSGAGGPDAVPPYESAFTSPAGRLFGPPEARMRGLLAGLDLRVAAGAGEPADHVAIEFAAMAKLAGTPAAAPRRGELARGLRGWLGAFRDACAAHDRRGFYVGAAMLAAALADLEPAG
jgi:TorA-specific chaperone